MTKTVFPSRIPHEPAVICDGAHCHSHHIDEVHRKVFQVCGECAHAFPTARAQRADYRRQVIWAVYRHERTNPGWRPPGTPRPSLLRTLYRMATVRISRILFCPHCTCDW